MDIVGMAVEEINETGGILGRPVVYVIEDGKGETSLSAAAATRVVMGQKALFYITEGRSEIVLANEFKSADMYKEFPHIMLGMATSHEAADLVFNDYDKFKFYFCNFNPEPGHYLWATQIFSIFNQLQPQVKKWALLYEDLLWTKMFREGYKELNLPTWDVMAKEDWNINVVYSKAFKARAGMYLPVLDTIAKSDAEMIFLVSSWFTDAEVFVKQWVDSPAKDIPLYIYGGVSQTHDFWKLTGGKCLGVCSGSGETPITDSTMPAVQKANARGIPCQLNVLCNYDDIYFMKKAIETVGGTDDVDAIIKAMETIETPGTSGKYKYVSEKIAPYFHSRVCADPSNPRKEIPGYFQAPSAQFQQDGEMVPLSPAQYAQINRFKTLEQLRKEAGWKGY